MKRGARALAVASLAAAAAAAAAQDRAEVERTTVTGQRELPKVLHIVPWQRALPPPAGGRPPYSLVDEALAPVDRDVLRRRIAYDAVLARPAPARTPSPATETPR